VLELRLARHDAELWVRDSLLGISTTVWLGYTYIYPQLSVAHSTFPTCPFLYLTGHPCPFCGGTRSFSAMWRGDLLHAARLYPLGPLLFLVTFPIAVYGLWAMTTRRSLAVRLPPRLQQLVLMTAVAVLGVSWSLKLLWLGN
jgi:hypothetical protein